MLFAVAGLALALVMGSAADVKGKWDGKITGQRPDGTTSEDTALLILDQKDATITGTVGGNESDQHPIISGAIDGSKVSLVAKNTRNGRELKLELTIDADDMKGTVTMGERQGQIVVKKRKE
jgi:hypothetical protein